MCICEQILFPATMIVFIISVTYSVVVVVVVFKIYNGASLMVQMAKNLPAMQESQV